MGLVSAALRRRARGNRNRAQARTLTHKRSQRDSDSRRSEGRTAALMTDDLIHGDWERISRHGRKSKISSRDAYRLRRAKGEWALIARLVAGLGLRVIRTKLVHGSGDFVRHGHFCGRRFRRALRRQIGNRRIPSDRRQQCRRHGDNQGHNRSIEAHVVLSTYPVISDVRPRPSSSLGRNRVLFKRNQSSAFDLAQSIRAYFPPKPSF